MVEIEETLCTRAQAALADDALHVQSGQNGNMLIGVETEQDLGA